MKRRDTLIAMLALGAAPQFVFAQAAARIYRVAVVLKSRSPCCCAPTG